MWGKAMFTIVTSNRIMKSEKEMTANTPHFLLPLEWEILIGWIKIPPFIPNLVGTYYYDNQFLMTLAIPYGRKQIL
jgi:hypothetical protein